MKPLRVLWITSEYHPRVGGLERYVEECIDELSCHCDIGLVTSEGQSVLPHQRCSHIAALNLGRPASQAEFEKNCGLLAAAARDFKADIVHFASAGLACYADAFTGEIPMLATVHCKDLTRPWQTMPDGDVRPSMIAGLRSCATVFCVSEYTKSQVDHFASGSPSVVLTPGLKFRGNEYREFATNDPAPSSDPIILTVSRLIERKGHLPLLRALEQVSLPFQWHIVGTGALQDTLQTYLAQSPIRDRVYLHGLVSDSELQRLYSECSLFALIPVIVVDQKGIDAEGFGLVYLEAATYHKACIASGVGGCAEAVIDNRTGILVDPEAIDDITRGVERLLSSPQLCHEMGDAAFERATRDFTWSERANVMMDHYRKALGRG